MKRTLRIVYDVVDEFIAHHVKEGERVGRPVTCRKGCHACCSVLPATVMLAEMMEVALELKDKCPDRVPAIYAEAVRQTRWLLGRHVTLDQWWTNQERCSLLHDGLCSAYETRPVICRSYVVISPASQCEGPSFGTVARVNDAKARDFAWGSSAQIHAEYGIPHLYGPLPFVFLCAVHVHARGAKRFAESIRGTVFADYKANLVFWLRLEGEKKFRAIVSPEMERELFGPRGLDELFDDRGMFIGELRGILMT